jgi:signal transduction histidine kinase
MDSSHLRVRDEGQGIRPDFLPHVFDRFAQAPSVARRPDGSLGIGLAIVREPVEAHGGTVRGDSPGEGRGSTFTVTLPTHELPAAEAGRPLLTMPRLSERSLDEARS